MLRHIFIHELTQNLYNYKFILLALLSIAVPIIATPLLIHDYHDRVLAYNLGLENAARELRKTAAYSALQIAVHKRPSPLAVFSQGIENQTSHRVTVSLKQVLTLDRQLGAGNPFLAIFPSFDLATVVLMFFSLFALAFSYNLVCGEKERGTLGLLLSHSVTRATFLMGKMAAGLLTLLTPLAFFFAIAFVSLVIMSPEVVQSLNWGYVLLIVLASILYATLFYLLGVLFSVVSQRSATSFLLSLSCWAILVVVMPEVIFNLSHEGHTGYKDGEIRRARAQIVTAYYEQIENVLRRNPPPRWQFGLPASFVVYDATPELSGYYARQIGPIEEQAVGSMSRLIERQYEYYQALNRQQQTLWLLHLTSPAGAYHFLTTALCGTGGSAHFHFLNACFRYRSELLDYFRANHLFAAPAMFAAQAALDLSDLPRFAEQDWRKADVWQIAVGFVYLALLAGITFSTAYVLFLRYDVR